MKKTVRRLIDQLADAWISVSILRGRGCLECGAREIWVTRGAAGFDATCRNCGARSELPPPPEQLELGYGG